MFLNYSGAWRNGKGSSTKQIFDTCIKHSYHKSCSSFIARRRIALFNSSRDCRETTSVIKYKIPSVPAYWLVLQVAVHVNIASVAKQEKHWNTERGGIRFVADDKGLFIPPGQDLGRYSAFVYNATVAFNVNCVGVSCSWVEKMNCVTTELWTHPKPCPRLPDTGWPLTVFLRDQLLYVVGMNIFVNSPALGILWLHGNLSFPSEERKQSVFSFLRNPQKKLKSPEAGSQCYFQSTYQIWSSF